MLSLLLTLAIGQPVQDTLTLRAAIDLAHRNRSQAELAAALTAEARAGVGVAGTIPNPVAQYQHTTTTFTEEAKLEQRLDWLLSRWPNRAAAQASLRGAVADSIQLLANLARDVRLAFYQSLASAETRRLIAEQGLLADSLVALAEKRVEAGDISIIEREQFAVEAGRARQAVLQAEQDESVARTALARAVGESQAAGMILVGPLDHGLDLATQRTEDDPAAIPALRRALADSAAAHSLARVAMLERLPIPSLIVGREWDTGPFDDASGGLFGFSVPIPIWNIGSANASVANARKHSAAARASEKRLEVTELLARTTAQLEATRARALFLRDSLLPRTRRLLTGVARLYRAGEINVLPVFDALRSERDVAAIYARTLFEFQQALAEWLALRGRVE